MILLIKIFGISYFGANCVCVWNVCVGVYCVYIYGCLYSSVYFKKIVLCDLM